MHRLVSLHQVAFLNQPTKAFIEHCHAIGVPGATLVSPLLASPAQMDEAAHAIAQHPVRINAINHVLCGRLDDEQGTQAAAQNLLHTIEQASQLRANTVYLLTGGRGELAWEAAADRFAALVAPCLDAARAAGITLLVENASGFNADIHIAHTLDDTTALARAAGIGVCIELHACWFEARLAEKLRRAMPHTGPVHVSDYVLGDRTAPCRAVPGDGVIPLASILGDILEAGYDGMFDIELVGERIEREGAQAASARACDYVSQLLTTLGA